jgi:hypothetical protein
MANDALDAQLELLQALTGTWTSEGAHPLLPGEAIRGRATFEWLEGGRFLIWRTHYEHPQIPDAVTVTGVIDDALAMQYFDARGVHRVYAVSVSPGIWRFSRDDRDFAQRSTSRFDADTIVTEGQLSHDGSTWDDDLRLTYRRTE